MTHQFKLLYDFPGIVLLEYLADLGYIKNVQININYNDKNPALACTLAYLPEAGTEKPCLLLLDTQIAKGIPEENNSVQLMVLNYPPVSGQNVDELASIGSVHAKCTSFKASETGGTIFESNVDVTATGCSMRLSFEGSNVSKQHFFGLGKIAQRLFTDPDNKWANKYLKTGSQILPVEINGITCKK